MKEHTLGKKHKRLLLARSNQNRSNETAPVPASSPTPTALDDINDRSRDARLVSNNVPIPTNHARSSTGRGNAPNPIKMENKVKPYNCKQCGEKGITVPKRVHKKKSEEHKRAMEKLYQQANEEFENLDRMNQWLVKLGHEAVATKQEAHTILKNDYHINIIDLLKENFHVHPTVEELAQYTKSNDLYFPLDQAKTEGLHAFLRILK